MILGWALAAAYVALLFLVTRRYADRSPNLADYAPRGTGPLVSVIIPARDEAVNIADCVRSILAARYHPLEILVVDDRSRDDTAAIVERLAAEPGASGRVTLLRGAEKPDGWFGKQWALHQGTRAARGELLLFADADTRHTAELIPRAVAALDAERVDLLTVLPRQLMESFWERLLQPHVFFVLGARLGSLRRVCRTRVAWDAIANGQFILTPRAAYAAVGGHEAVRDSVVDDLALAQAYVRAGRDLFLIHARAYMATRMYRSLGEIFAGWSKNLALGAPLMFPPHRLLRRLIPWVGWLPGLLWLWPPVVWAATGWGPAALATMACVAIWATVCREEGAPVGYALLFPLAEMMVMAILLRSAVRGSRVEWKGRRYAARR